LKTPGFIKVADRELRIISESKSARMLLLWIPAVTFVLLAFIYQAGALRKVSVAIADQDHSKLSRLLVQYVNSSPDMQVTYYLDSGDDLETFFLNHVEKAVYHIPKGFEQTIKPLFRCLPTLPTSCMAMCCNAMPCSSELPFPQALPWKNWWHRD